MNDSTEQPDYRLIDTDKELDKLCRNLLKQNTVALDLEADSMYHFKDRICLLQISTKDGNYVIDPLQIGDMSPLGQVLSNPEIQKILHGSDYDIRCLKRDYGFEINNLFDTQIACRFLGYRATGLDPVVRSVFNVVLNKKYQKKDWSVRPLPREMIEYAAKDSVYLLPLAEKLKNELIEKERLFWVMEECLLLSTVEYCPPDSYPLYMKFKGAGRLRPRNLAILEALLQLRVSIARKKDKPLFKIFGNNTLLQIAISMPVCSNHLESTRTLSRKQIHMYGDTVLETVQQALEIPETQLPVYPKKKGPVIRPNVPKVIKAIKVWRDNRANDLRIDPTIICTKSVMTAIAMKKPQEFTQLDDIQEMRQWQKQVFGEDIIRILCRF